MVCLEREEFLVPDVQFDLAELQLVLEAGQVGGGEGWMGGGVRFQTRLGRLAQGQRIQGGRRFHGGVTRLADIGSGDPPARWKKMNYER